MQQGGSRETAIAGGFAILGIGLVVTFVSMGAAAGGGSYVIAIGAILGGAIRIAMGLAMPKPAGPELNADQRDQLVGRFGPEDPTPQLAGAACVHCGVKITAVLEAIACKTCNRPLHNDCKKDHKSTAHGKRPRATYR